MKLFMCFGGAAAVVDDEAAAEAAARHRDQRGRSLSFRARFLSGKKGSKKKPSAASPLAESKKRGMDDADNFYGGVFGPSTASSVASSALLSSAASLDSDSFSSWSSSHSSTASSSPSVSGVLFPPPAKRRANNKGSSPAAGAAAVVLCLLMVVFCGRLGATLLTSTALYLFPRRWPARTHGEHGLDSMECEEITARRKVVMDQGFLLRNRKK